MIFELNTELFRVSEWLKANKLTLKLTEHIKYINNKIYKSIGIIHKCKYILNKNTLCNLYNLFVLPYLIYGIEVCGTTKKTYIIRMTSHAGYFS